MIDKSIPKVDEPY